MTKPPVRMRKKRQAIKDQLRRDAERRKHERVKSDKARAVKMYTEQKHTVNFIADVLKRDKRFVSAALNEANIQRRRPRGASQAGKSWKIAAAKYYREHNLPGVAAQFADEHQTN